MNHLHRTLTSQLKKWGVQVFTKRQCSQSVVPVSEYIERGNYLFSQEQKRQLEAVGRVEKIAVEVSAPTEDITMMMNKDISTPYDCCRHISLPLCHQSPLAVINDSILWDMHRPLPGECKLRFLSFRDKEPLYLNEAFWRTGSLVLGAVIMRAFKEEAGASLWSFPDVLLRSGSFIYDALLHLDEWSPTVDELKVLSAEFLSFVHQNHKIERLDVTKSVACEIFQGNKYKLHDIKKIAGDSPDHLVTLYRVGDHIDVSTGPMVGDTSFFGRCSVVAVHALQGAVLIPLYRFQGIALPKGILLNSFAYSIIAARAEVLNEIPLPGIDDKWQPYGERGSIPRNSDSKVNPNPSEFGSFRLI